MSVKDYFSRVADEQPPEVFQHTGKVGESCFLDKGDRFQKPDDAQDDDWRHNLREARKRNTPSGKPANRGWIFDFTNSDSDSTLELEFECESKKKQPAMDKKKKMKKKRKQPHDDVSAIALPGAFTGRFYRACLCGHSQH